MTDSGRPIRHVVRVQAPIDVVRTYFTDPKRMAEWWPTRATIDARVGGEVALEFDRPDGQTDERDPDLPPGSSRVEISLEPDGLATVVRLAHHGLPKSQRRRHDDGWSYFLGRLTIAAGSVA